jgi:uncharacterized protein involved in oxidation of intracellular sulfur
MSIEAAGRPVKQPPLELDARRRLNRLDNTDGAGGQLAPGAALRYPDPASRAAPMKITMILNDASYGSERTFNALRLADTLLTLDEEVELTVCLLGDAVWCAKQGQTTPDGYYNLGRMLRPVLRRGLVLVCETCMAARGLLAQDLLEGCRQARLGEVGLMVLDADKVLTF